MTIWRMRIACCIPNATNTNSEYVVLTAFPQQQWLHERASMLRYTYVACLLKILETRCSLNGTVYSCIKCIKIQFLPHMTHNLVPTETNSVLLSETCAV
jgi:hypothetical protein